MFSNDFEYSEPKLLFVSQHYVFMFSEQCNFLSFVLHLTIFLLTVYELYINKYTSGPYYRYTTRIRKISSHYRFIIIINSMNYSLPKIKKNCGNHLREFYVYFIDGSIIISYFWLVPSDFRNHIFHNTTIVNCIVLAIVITSSLSFVTT